MAVFEAEKNGVLLTNDPSKVNLEDVCDLIEKQYWGPSRVRRTTKKAFENSYSFVLLKDGALVGCARVVTDFVTCAYIEDVVVEDSLRGMGIGQWMIDQIMHCPGTAISCWPLPAMMLVCFRRWRPSSTSCAPRPTKTALLRW